MEFLNRAVEYFTKNVFKKTRDDNVVEISRLDAYLNYIYKILNWDDPKLSWTTFIVVNFLFMLIIQYEVKLYGFIFYVILMTLLTDLYFEKMGLQEPRTIQSDSLRQVVKLIKGTLIYLHSLKKDNPSMFCGVMVTTFLSLSFIGRNFSGHAIIYICILALFFGPYVISIIPIEYKNKVKYILFTFINSEGVVAETELIPFMNEKDFIDERDDLDSLLTDNDKTQDSVTNSLISGISGMPSYLDADINLDELEEDDLLPLSKLKSYTPAIYDSSDSDSEHRNMEFDSAHFNKDSSSDEEVKYGQGMTFSDVIDPSNAIAASMLQSMGAGLLSNISAMGSNILSNVLSSDVKTSKAAVRQDSDSDFEIINSEDAET